jgi:hypothetical protein
VLVFTLCGTASASSENSTISNCTNCTPIGGGGIIPFPNPIYLGTETTDGNNVSVQIHSVPSTIPSTSPQVNVTFENVTQSGYTNLEVLDSVPELPTGFMIDQSPAYYEIETTAVYSGPITIAIPYTGNYENENALRLLHYTNGTWEDVTTFVDTVNHIIYGTVDSLSPFVVIQKSTIVTVPITMLIGGTKGNSVEFQIIQEGKVVASETIIRETGSPTEQEVTVFVNIDTSKPYTGSLIFNTGDTLSGSTPVCLIIDGNETKITTFTTQKKDSTTYNQVYDFQLSELVTSVNNV